MIQTLRVFSNNHKGPKTLMRPKNSNQGTNPNQGFTLIELLVVLVIVSILLVLGGIGTSKVLDTAKKAQCSSNLRQIGLGVLNYANDHNNFLPLSWSPTEPQWYVLLIEEGYLSRSNPGSKSDIFTSPGAKKKVAAGYNGSTYAVHDALFRGSDRSLFPGEVLTNLLQLRNSTETILIANTAQVFNDGSGYTSFWEPWQLNPTWINTGEVPLNEAVPLGPNVDDSTNGGHIRYPHDNNTSTNVLMADGHVENIKQGSIEYRNVHPIRN